MRHPSQRPCRPGPRPRSPHALQPLVARPSSLESAQPLRRVSTQRHQLRRVTLQFSDDAWSSPRRTSPGWAWPDGGDCSSKGSTSINSSSSRSSGGRAALARARAPRAGRQLPDIRGGRGQRPLQFSAALGESRRLAFGRLVAACAPETGVCSSSALEREPQVYFKRRQFVISGRCSRCEATRSITDPPA